MSTQHGYKESTEDFLLIKVGESIMNIFYITDADVEGYDDKDSLYFYPSAFEDEIYPECMMYFIPSQGQNGLTYYKPMTGFLFFQHKKDRDTRKKLEEIIHDNRAIKK